MKYSISLILALFIGSLIICDTATAQQAEKTKKESKKKSAKKSKNDESSLSESMEVFGGKAAEGTDEGGMTAEQMEVMSKLFGSDAKFEEVYSFSSSFLFEVTSNTNDNKKSVTVYEMAASANGESYLMEILSTDGAKPDPRGRMIFDHKNKSLVSLIDDGADRNGIIMTFDPESIAARTIEMDDDIDAGSNNVSFKKTGLIRQLNGFQCEQYIYLSDEADGEMWISDASELQGVGFFGMFGYGQKKHKTFANVPGYPEGFVMEMTTTDKTNNESATIKVTQIELQKSQEVQTSTYQMISMGSLMGQ
jgi:hypothetical protein